MVRQANRCGRRGAAQVAHSCLDDAVEQRLITVRENQVAKGRELYLGNPT